MDIVAAFPSVAEKCLLRKMRKMRIDEDLVGWTPSFMRERRVKMVIDGHEEEEIGVTTGLPQGSAVSPILFVIYISEVHGAVEGKCNIDSISFVDDVTWIETGRSIPEVQGKLGRAASQAMAWV